MADIVFATSTGSDTNPYHMLAWVINYYIAALKLEEANHGPYPNTRATRYH